MTFYEKIGAAKVKKNTHPEMDLHCNHPACSVRSPTAMFSPFEDFEPRSLCKKHGKDKRTGLITTIPFDRDDLDPREPNCSMSECTQLNYHRGNYKRRQWLFYCGVCKSSACVWCAKKCHEAGHVLDGVEYRTGDCSRTTILSVKHVFEASYTTPLGKKVKVEHVLPNMNRTNSASPTWTKIIHE